MNENTRNPLTELPADIAAIGIELSRAIHVQHRRRTLRRSRARRAAVVLATPAVGSGTALAAELVGRDGYFTNPCYARAVTAPRGTYTSLAQLHKACGFRTHLRAGLAIRRHCQVPRRSRERHHPTAVEETYQHDHRHVAVGSLWQAG